MWLQVARELTEYWMHHQHIAEAVGRNSLKSRRFLLPVLSTFIHAMPRTYAGVQAPLNTLVKVVFGGAAASEWHLVYETEGWRLYESSALAPAATLLVPDDIAWRVFTKGIDPEQARSQCQLEGDRSLAIPFFDTVAILA